VRAGVGVYRAKFVFEEGVDHACNASAGCYERGSRAWTGGGGNSGFSGFGASWNIGAGRIA
jgi:hypothetical protein